MQLEMCNKTYVMKMSNKSYEANEIEYINRRIKIIYIRESM